MAGTLPTGTDFPGGLDGLSNGYAAVSAGQIWTAAYANNLLSAELAIEDTLGPSPGTKDYKLHARVATAAALPSNTYSGATQTLTATANGALVVDGVTVNTNDRLLVKNEATATNNGVYIVTNTGSGSAAYVLTRASDYNGSYLIPPASSASVSEGTLNAATTWLLTTVTPMTLDLDNLTYAQVGAYLTSALPVSSGGTGATTEAGAESHLGLTQATDANLEALGTGALEVTTGSGALSSVAPGTYGNYLLSNGSSWTSGTLTPSGATNSAAAWYGSGVDGNVTVSSITTLTRNMAYENLTVSGILITANYRIQCQNPIVMSGGTIACDGGNGGKIVGNTTEFYVAGVAIPSGFYNGGGAGGSGGGGVYSPNGAPGNAPQGGSAVFSQTGGVGGAGSYNGNPYTGGAGYVTTGLGNTSGGGQAALQAPPELMDHFLVGSSGVTLIWNASGVGAGGGADGSGYGGGGGGAGGGTIVIACPSMTGSGSIAAVGGNGGPASNVTTTPAPLRGGGGGGGGGFVGLIMDTALPANITITVAGGSGGAGFGTGGGYPGGAGGNGTSIVLLNIAT